MPPTGSRGFGQETEGTYLKYRKQVTYTDKGAAPAWIGLHRLHFRQPLLTGLNIISNRHTNHPAMFTLGDEPNPDPALSSDPTKPATSAAKRSKRGITRRQFLKGSAAVGVALGTGGLGYTWFGEPNWLEKIYIRLELPDLPASLNGMRLVQFSDMHLGMGKNTSDLEQLVDVINKEKPDMICFTGDIVDEYAQELVAGVAALQRLQAPLGKYAVLGNHDYLDDVVAVTRLLQQGDFDVLINEHRLVRRPDGILAIAGLDDQLLGNPDVQKAARGIPEQACRLLLMHEPDYADRVPEELEFRLQLSGHSHGGQIRLPLFGAIITPKGSRKYIMGGYRAGKGGHLPLYVNRGIGMSQLPIRFMCRPELTIFTFYRKEQS